jgi:hypothetical protein
MPDAHKRLIAAVGQAPFSLENGQFCKLVPLMYEDGEEVREADFCNDGEIWWMLTNLTAPLAIPGKLLRIEVEEAPNFRKDERDNSMYQACRDSPHNLTLECPVEILEAPAQLLASITDLVDREVSIPVTHEPTSVVLFRWQDSYYGPFGTHSYDPSRKSVMLQPCGTDRTVTCLPRGEFDSQCAQFIQVVEVKVSLSTQPRCKSSAIKEFRYSLLLPDGVERFLSAKGQIINLEAFSESLMRMAKGCLTRRERKQLRPLLSVLRENVSKADDQQALIRRLEQVEELAQEQDEAFDHFVDTLLEGGGLGEKRLRRAEERYAKQYIHDHSAELQAEIEERIEELRMERDQLEVVFASEKQKQDAELNRKRLEQGASLKREREETETFCRNAKTEIEGARAKLVEEREKVQSGLEEAAELLSLSGDEVTSRFLATLPLLQKFDILRHGNNGGETSQPHQPVEARSVPAFKIPEVLLRSSPAAGPIDEHEFFERFRNYVRAAAFVYRDLDLKRFHASMKCGGLTIVGGPSGIGKSSLAQLYARALAGEDGDSRRPDFLMVNVRPSWMETADLVGHVNSLEQRFFPSETGLFQHLVYAAAEADAVGDQTALYPVCLDEMNLAQVEHYFSDFLQIMERQLEDRVLPCFTEQTVGEKCPFREWSRVPVSSALRFVGTVNVDETTRRLSDRLLDRANLVSLRCDSLPSIIAGGVSKSWPEATGPRVKLADFNSWTHRTPLPPKLAVLVDQLRPSLHSLGAPMTARSYQGICRFVASAEPLMTPAQALDVQIAQRLLSKVRDIVTDSQREAFEDLETVIRESEIGPFEESHFLLRQIRMSEILQELDLGN